MYGARPLNRLIQQRVLNPLARLIIDGGVRDGETARVTTDESGEIVVERNHEADENAAAGAKDDEDMVDVEVEEVD